MFGGFTERSQRAFYTAAEEAQRLGHNYIGTEHVLLGIAKEGGQASKILKEFGVTENKIKDLIIEIEGQGDIELRLQEIPLTPRTKRLIEISRNEARNLNQNFIAPEHLLLALTVENEGVAIAILQKLGVDLSKLRNEIINNIATESINKKSMEEEE